MTAGDAWLRRGAKPRGKIEAEPITRPPTPSERMSSAVRAAAGRSLRVARPTDNAADQ